MIDKDLIVLGDANINKLNVNNEINTDTIKVDKLAKFSGDILTEDIKVNKKLEVNNLATIKKLISDDISTKHLDIENDANVNNNLVVNKDIVVGNSLKVDERVTTSDLEYWKVSNW